MTLFELNPKEDGIPYFKAIPKELSNLSGNNSVMFFLSRLIGIYPECSGVTDISPQNLPEYSGSIL